MMEEFEEMKKSVAEYHLTSDLFAGKVFEDLEASQELCRILLQNDFRNSAPFYKMENFPGIVERVKFFKIKEEGVTIMCEIADRIRKEGKIEGKIEDILELLGDFGKVPERLIERISREVNPEQLSKWLKYAAKVSSLAEFEAGMNI